ncbi:Alpha/Beta hydrolase protein [Truncatella angustata]|uniref:Alpha/Beta hydrolase protein n=1 Tax=Truncatella angustata TaxID=152316 RepID=A0A9P8RIH6_9PEZI|nr:Alpha/Beta hydrolase protein [Truncatella angustata]KAH6646653.1 Alpha/Beta hydrolase protein [Truncatella angustata]
MVRVLRCAAALLALFTNIAATTGPIVEIKPKNIKYQGVLKDSVEEFHSIKFAHDTSGPRRFAPPEPYTPPDGSKIDATTPGPACPQIRDPIPPFFGAAPDQSEDCLHLRISRPAGTTAIDRLPVVVHIVGGGVIKGHTQEPLFDPVNLITHSSSIKKPIIHVVLNYRVTIFGFARLPILKDQRSLNVGMRDQRAGYQWVKDNISSFGGDPDRITSFGLSSGGTFSSLHLVTYGGEQGVPFTRAWAMSGPPGTALNMTSDATEIHTRAVAEALGCAYKEDQDILDCLREIPMNKLTEIAMAYSINNHPPAGLFTFIPSIDGDFLPDRQSTLYKAGRFVKGVPMVFGWAHDDGATNAGIATTYEIEADIKAVIKNFAHALTEEDYKSLFSLYAVSDFETEVSNYDARRGESDPKVSIHYFRAARIMRDLLFTCSSLDFGSVITKHSKALDQSFPGVHLYNLNQSMVTPLFQAAGMPWLGVIHGSDVDYIYNNMFTRDKMSEQDLQLSNQILAYFINFAYTGDPNHNGSSAWPEAFPTKNDLEVTDIELSNPLETNVQLIGGPWGTGSCHLTKDAKVVGKVEDMQRMIDSTQFGEMNTGSRQQGQQEFEREKLVERCAFINSLAGRLGN